MGVPLYTQTAAIWARGHLVHEFGVDLGAIHWVEGAVEQAGSHGRPHAPPLLQPVHIERNAGRRSLGALLARGEIDALIGSRKPDEFYEFVERHCPGAKLELYARERRPGWQAWGGETEFFVARPGDEEAA